MQRSSTVFVALHNLIARVSRHAHSGGTVMGACFEDLFFFQAGPNSDPIYITLPFAIVTNNHNNHNINISVGFPLQCTPKDSSRTKLRV